MAWLYGIQSGLFLKIGVTNNIHDRMKLMNLYNPHPCKVVIKRQLHGDAFWVERRVHQVLAAHAIGREWFAVDVALARAALAVVLRDLAATQAEYAVWLAEVQQKAAEKEARRAARGLMVDSEASKSRRLKRDNKIKMLERLNDR